MTTRRSAKSAANANTQKRTPTVAQVADEIAAQLRRMGDPVRARGTQRYFKNEVVSLGITAPVLRLFVRTRMSGLRKAWGLQDAIQLCDRLLREPEMEVRGAGILALGAFKGELTPALLAPSKSWLKCRLDNWALVDSFCSSVLSPLLERHASVVATLRQWSADKSLWVRRAALVTLVPFARHGRFLDLAYGFAREHLPDHEDLMHKAVGWLLREAGKTDMPRLKQFLLRHGPSIPRTSLRYAIERFPAGERSRLLEATRRAIGAEQRGADGGGSPRSRRQSGDSPPADGRALRQNPEPDDEAAATRKV